MWLRAFGIPEFINPRVNWTDELILNFGLNYVSKHGILNLQEVIPLCKYSI